jgi:outer membrane murein-binding lipoprotein Lpp
MNHISILRLGAAIALAAVLAGCSTPRPARELASQGAVMADKAQREADEFVARAERAYQRREAIVRGLARGEIDDAASGSFRAFVDARVGVANAQAQVDLVKALADRSRTLREQADRALAVHDQKLAQAAGPAVKANATQLADAKRAFIVLSQELTPAEWLAFAQAYLKQLNTQLKALADADAAPAKSDGH